MAKAAFSLPDYTFTHPAYRALSPLERVLLGELLAIAQRVGTSEPIVCSARQAANMCNVQKSAAAEALSSLKKKGFLVLVKTGERRRGVKASAASEYRITCLPYQGEPPTCDYHLVYCKDLNRKQAALIKRGVKFLTPELEAIWVGNTAGADLEASHDPSQGLLSSRSHNRGDNRELLQDFPLYMSVLPDDHSEHVEVKEEKIDRSILLTCPPRRTHRSAISSATADTFGPFCLQKSGRPH